MGITRRVRRGKAKMTSDDAMRASDGDREHAAEMLRNAYAAGRIDLGELHHRAGAAYSATTWGELRDLTADLPAGQVRSRAASGAESPTGAARPGHGPRRPRAAIWVTAVIWLAIAAAAHTAAAIRWSCSRCSCCAQPRRAGPTRHSLPWVRQAIRLCVRGAARPLAFTAPQAVHHAAVFSAPVVVPLVATASVAAGRAARRGGLCRLGGAMTLPGPGLGAGSEVWLMPVIYVPWAFLAGSVRSQSPGCPGGLARCSR
jgi:DUF1707 SHOCT-like domain